MLVLHLSMNIYKPTAKMLISTQNVKGYGSNNGLNHATAGCYRALKEKINLNKIH